MEFKYVETNRELETNEKVQAQWKLYDARQHKRRRCYKKKLVNPHSLKFFIIYE